jgi:FkbM family methyltransferase
MDVGANIGVTALAMAALRPAMITVGSRQLTLIELHQTYLDQIDGTEADKTMVASDIAGLPPNSDLMDVGANIGVIALAMAALRPDCRIIAFEAVPDNAACLRHNIQANGIGNVEVIEAAVGEAPGVTKMTNQGPWSIASGTGELHCRTVKLDDYATPAVRFIKIDVEGHEPNVLAGATKLLASTQPMLLMEFNTWTLLLHHYDPLVFASAIWEAFDVNAIYRGGTSVSLPKDGRTFAYMTVGAHGITDLLLRPSGVMPDLAGMTEAPGCQRLKAEIAALHASTSWRIMAPLRSLKRAIRSFT